MNFMIMFKMTVKTFCHVKPVLVFIICIYNQIGSDEKLKRGLNIYIMNS